MKKHGGVLPCRPETGDGEGRRRGGVAVVNTFFFTFFFALPLIVLFALVYQLRNHKIEPQLTRSTKNTTQKNKQKRLPFLSLFESRQGCDSGVVETYGLGCNVLFSSFVLIAIWKSRLCYDSDYCGSIV